MAKSTKPKPESREREEVPQGRETPSLGPRKTRTKVRPLNGKPAIDRPYEPGAERPAEDLWQDPGGRG